MPSRALRNLTRRELLRKGLIAGSLTAAAAAGLPTVLEQVVYAAAMENVKSQNTIGLIQLAGGNDGLNTVIPLNAGLQNRRGTFATAMISQAQAAGTTLNADFALHPSLKNMAKRFKMGQLAVLMDVGYPMMSKSHFVGTQIWQRGDPTQRQLSGAFGRVVDMIDDQGHPFCGCGVGYDTVPGIMRPTQAQVAVLPTNPTLYGFKGGVEQAVSTLWKNGVPGPYGAMLTGFMGTALGTSAQVKQVDTTYRQQGDYAGVNNVQVFPQKNNLAQNLRVAAMMIKGGAQMNVFTTTEGGFDEHSDEAARQTDLLLTFDQAVDAFLADCAAAGKSPTIAVYSEFSRTIQVNNNGGTDHGQAGPMLIVGQNVNGGIYGTAPNLTGYDVPYQTDFRSMYATLIDHLGVDPKAVVGNFPIIPLLNNNAVAAPPPAPAPASGARTAS